MSMMCMHVYSYTQLLTVQLKQISICIWDFQAHDLYSVCLNEWKIIHNSLFRNNITAKQQHYMVTKCKSNTARFCKMICFKFEQAFVHCGCTVLHFVLWCIHTCTHLQSHNKHRHISRTTPRISHVVVVRQPNPSESLSLWETINTSMLENC